MASTGAVGGSQIDVQGLVSQLVAAERAPVQSRINSRELQLSTKISAVGAIKGALSAFKSSLDALRSSDIYNARKATTSNADLVAISASSTAAAGTYEVEVLDVASAHQLRSSIFAGGSSAVVGTGTLTIASGTESFEIVVDDSNKTLAGIAAAINASSSNKSVEATLLNGAGGSYLVLTAKATGESAGIKISQSGGDGGLGSIAYDPPTTTNMTQIQPARDARIQIAGIEAKSATNVFTNVIDGVTITAKAKPTTAGTKVGVTVERNTAATTDAVKKFVNAYNTMQAAFAKMRAYDPASRSGGPLVGDSMLRGIEDQVRRALGNPVSGVEGEFTTLASLGIKSTASGQLQLDEAKLSKAMASDFTAASKVFASDDGVANRLNSFIQSKLDTDSEIEGRIKGLNAQLKQVDKDRQAMETRLEAAQARYLKQFSTLDTLLSNMQSTSAYLGQQLANLPKVGG